MLDKTFDPKKIEMIKIEVISKVVLISFFNTLELHKIIELTLLIIF